MLRWNWESGHQDPAVQPVDDSGAEQAISSTDPSALPFGKPGGGMRSQPMPGHWLPGKLDHGGDGQHRDSGAAKGQEDVLRCLKLLEIEHRMASRPAIPAELRRKVQVERGQPYCPRLPRLAPIHQRGSKAIGSGFLEVQGFLCQDWIRLPQVFIGTNLNFNLVDVLQFVFYRS